VAEKISEVQQDVVIPPSRARISSVDKLQITLYGAAMFIKKMKNVEKIGKVR
jgi:hypothetical protein